MVQPSQFVNQNSFIISIWKVQKRCPLINIISIYKLISYNDILLYYSIISTCLFIYFEIVNPSLSLYSLFCLSAFDITQRPHSLLMTDWNSIEIPTTELLMDNNRQQQHVVDGDRQPARGSSLVDMMEQEQVRKDRD